MLQPGSFAKFPLILDPQSGPSLPQPPCRIGRLIASIFGVFHVIRIAFPHLLFNRRFGVLHRMTIYHILGS